VSNKIIRDIQKGGVTTKSVTVASNVRSWAIAFTLFLGGCAATGPVFEDAPPPGTTDALVYIYRTNTGGHGARDAYFYVDNVNIGDLSKNGYTWFRIPAGEYTLKQKWPADTLWLSTPEQKVKWSAGQTYYYRFRTSLERIKSKGQHLSDAIVGTLAGTTVSADVETRQDFSEVDARTGRDEIQRARLQPSFGQGQLLDIGKK